MNSKKSISKLRSEVLTNAKHLGVSDLKISDRLKIDASMYQPEQVLALYTSELRNEERKCKNGESMPYKHLPNSVVYEILNSKYDGVSSLFGVAERIDKEGRLILNGRNIKANRFVGYRFNHLGHLRDNDEHKEYGSQAIKLIKCEAFQVMALGAVFPAGQRELTIDQVNKIMEGLKTLVAEELVDISLRRVYIPKANGKIRPLGVPTKVGRIYLHMGYCLTVGYRMGKDKNDAYVPGRGIHTAGLKIIDKLDKKENIYEFDLSNFFPSVNLKALHEIMINELKIPARVAGYLTALNRSITILEKEDLIDESSDRKVFLTPSGKINPNLTGELKIRVQKAINAKMPMKELAKLLPNEEGKLYKEIGVAQGAGTSCSLSTISLTNLWAGFDENLVMYADDGICFPEKVEDIEKLTDAPRGVVKNESKSGGIKKQGKLIKKSFKFLGLELTGGENQDKCKIKSATRNGASLELTESKSLLIYLQIEWDKLRHLDGLIPGKTLYVIRYGGKGSYTLGKTYINPKAKGISEKLAQMTIGEGLSTKIDEFSTLSSCDKIRNLFLQRGLGTLSEMYNGSGGKLRYEALNKILGGSGVHQNSGRYLHDELLSDPREGLVVKYWRKFKENGIVLNLKRPYHILNIDLVCGCSSFRRLTEENQALCQKLFMEMADYQKLLEKGYNTSDFESTLNSCFTWHKPIKGVVVPELRKLLLYLLKDNPLSMEGMRTLATAELLQNRGKLDKETTIRGFAFRRSDWEIVRKLKTNVKVEGKLMNMKKIRKEAGGPSNLKVID